MLAVDDRRCQEGRFGMRRYIARRYGKKLSGSAIFLACATQQDRHGVGEHRGIRAGLSQPGYRSISLVSITGQASDRILVCVLKNYRDGDAQRLQAGCCVKVDHVSPSRTADTDALFSQEVEWNVRPSALFPRTSCMARYEGRYRLKSGQAKG